MDDEAEDEMTEAIDMGMDGEIDDEMAADKKRNKMSKRKSGKKGKKGGCGARGKEANI
jgi:hypothetical protein